MSTKMKNASRPETLTPLLAPCLYRSQALLRVFDKHRAEFEDAVKEGTKVLRDENISQAKAALPAVCSCQTPSQLCTRPTECLSFPSVSRSATATNTS